MADLEVINVTVRYRKKIGIKDATFSANDGEIIGLIGADGSGKSSLLHSIAGVIRFEGKIVYKGIVYTSPKEAEPIKKFTGLMPQGIGLVLYPLLTVKEHLEFFTAIRNIKKDEEYYRYRERLLKMAGLYQFQNREAGKLSGGMQQKLSLICTLIHRPKLLILDEPTTGVDPLSRRELWEIIDQIRKKEHIIAVISTGYMQEAEKMDRVLLFEDGKIIAEGTADQLKESVKEYTYVETSCEDECFSFNRKTYSLKPLPVPHEKPDLEAVFFVNTLKKVKRIPEIHIEERETELDIPDIVMEAKGLTKRFGKFTAVDKVSMILKKGEILGLLGPNGAGKTTFIKMLLGLYPIDEGELELLGKKIKSPQDRIQLKSMIGYVSQRFSLYKDMTVRENLLYFANLHKIPPSKSLNRIKRLSESLGFSQYLDYLPTELPIGINQRFSVAAAILHEPVVLFLDEPTSGVDAVARAQFWKLVHQLRDKWGISILVTTHYMSEAEYCDRVVLLRQGKKVVDDTVENLHRKFPEAESFEDIFVRFYR
ncbi:MAG TPA: ABC transporter ATP-binding protein [Persephonella sp.]|uniref:Multidrug ABC transporter n=1 Tax=Persephonella marina (strain DSM 14350 / EX-H1) TaxID=123214 RepID=C0QPJ9_PERMH|nr:MULTISPECIES: ATP-binding cassette domain-containing protein [Persephonella]ACO04410.1 multidrug ABC transporter [Persephonella marina EX-H1]HCB69790.1 ABC transporter ATP-binding protein [Persephonella sp.]